MINKVLKFHIKPIVTGTLASLELYGHELLVEDYDKEADEIREAICQIFCPNKLTNKFADTSLDHIQLLLQEAMYATDRTEKERKVKTARALLMVLYRGL